MAPRPFRVTSARYSGLGVVETRVTVCCSGGDGLETDDDPPPRPIRIEGAARRDAGSRWNRDGHRSTLEFDAEHSSFKWM
jgi:hypothetical protein